MQDARPGPIRPDVSTAASVSVPPYERLGNHPSRRIVLDRAMQVFSSEYIESLTRRWQSRSEKDWPLVASIALQEHRSDDRARIEEYVAELHPEDQPRIARNLQSQFVTAYGELLVGHLLVSARLRPRYEPTLRTATSICTPDWYIDVETPIVCDVFTAGLQHQRDAYETAMRDIEARIAAIPGDYTILLKVENAADLDARDRKNLAGNIQRWLGKTPKEGDTLSIGSARVEILHFGGGRIDVITTESIHIVETPAKLAENFEEKARRYAPLGFPVIAAAVKHYRAEIHQFAVEDVLLGTLARVSRQTTFGQIVGKTERRADGVFSARPDLSAAVWLEPYHLPKPVLGVWSNPAARFAVATDVLEQLGAVDL